MSDYIESANGLYRLAMQPDGNVVVYQRSGAGWVAQWALNKLTPPAWPFPPVPPPDPEPEPVPLPKRAGVVRLDGEAFADDGGAWNAVGASLFWGAWGYKFDRARLEQNLDYLARSGAVDYIRVLGAVGPGFGWADRTVDPTWPDYDAVIAGLTDLAYDTYGLRVQWTVFGGVDLTPTPESRAVLVERFVSMARSRADKVQHWEVANEAYQTGFSGDAGRDEARALAAQLRAGTPHSVAITAPQDEPGMPAYWYDGSDANLLTVHLDRNTALSCAEWRPHRQAWEIQFVEGVPRAWTSNEPIGPQSSVAADEDPVRLSMGAALTWLCGGAAYVLHAGAGIRGGGAADQARGRAANFWESPNMDAILAALVWVREAMPTSVQNWQRHNSNNKFSGYPFDTQPLADAIERGAMCRAFAASTDTEFVVLPIRLVEPVTFVARRAMTVTAAVVGSGGLLVRDLAEGGSLTLDPAPLPNGGTYLLRGQWA